MDRAYLSGAAGSSPTAPASPAIGYPQAGNPGTGTQATKPGPHWYHMITESLVRIIEAAGFTPAQANYDLLGNAIKHASVLQSGTRAPCRAVSTSNITLSGAQTIDGVAVVAGDRVLVAGQTTASQNGIYIVATGAWARAGDADLSAKVISGMLVPVSEGSTNANSLFRLTTVAPITLNTTALAFANAVSAQKIANNVNDFRLTLSAGVPVTTSDVTGASTLYCTPHKGNRIALYDGSAWNIRTSSEFSIALSGLTSGKPYDVFVYDNAGVPTLELLAWTNDSTRATALAYQDGVLSKSGALTRRYVGSFYSTGTNTTEDSAAKRFLYNRHNKVEKNLFRAESTASWTYSTNAYRQANGSTANQVDVMRGNDEDLSSFTVYGAAYSSSGSNLSVGIGLNSTTVSSAQINSGYLAAGGGPNAASPLSCEYKGFIGLGLVSVKMLEKYSASGAGTWYGANPTDPLLAGKTGIVGSVWC